MSKKVVIVVILILVLIVILFLAKNYPGKEATQTGPCVMLEEKTAVKVAQPQYVVKEPPVQAAKEKIVAKQTKTKRVFLGNRGYVIKDTKSTYIKPSILEQLRKSQYYKEVSE